MGKFKASSILPLYIFTLLFVGCSELLKNGSVAPVMISTADATDTTSVAFGNVRTGEINTKLMTLTNIGHLKLKSISFSFENGNHFDFTGGQYPGTNGSCGTELEVGQSCQFELAFEPRAIKGLSDTLIVAYTNDVTSFSSRTTLTGEGLTGFSLAGRAVSMTQEASLFKSQIGGQTVIHVVYVSDEYCAQFDCGATNIVYRNSADNFARRIDVTQNKFIASTLPRGVVKSDGTVVIAYLSKELNASINNVAMRTLGVGASQVSERVDITSETANGPANPFLAIDSNDVIYLTYDSREYCNSNSCSNRKVVVRKSDDNYSTRIDVGTGLSGDCSQPQVAIQRGTDTAHLMFRAPPAGAGYYSGHTTSASSFSSINRFYLNFYQPHFTMGVKSDGTVFVAYGNLGSGPLGNCPNGWEYDYRTSSDGFAQQTSFGCEVWGYPGIASVPAVVVDNSDVVHVAYVTNEGNTGEVVAYRNSGDSFSAVNYVSGYGGVNYYAGLAIGDGGMKYVVSSTSSHFTYNGLNLYSGVSSFSRQSLSGSATGGAKFGADAAGNIWVAYLSRDYCESHACSLLNIAVRKLNSDDAPMNVTTFTSASAIIGAFGVYPRPNGQVDVIYDSLEYNGRLNLVLRSSSDNFASPTYITTGSGYDSSLSSASLDSLGVLHVSYAANSQAYYKNSTNWSSSTLVNSGAGYVPDLAVDSTGTKVGISYGGNETGMWVPAIRDNSDNFAARRYAASPGARPYNTRLIYDNLGNLLFFYQSQEAVSGVYNFGYRSSENNFSSRVTPFTFTSANKLSNCYSQSLTFIRPALAVSNSGLIHMLYASGEQNPDQCNLQYRNSSDWSAATDITVGKNAIPEAVFLDPSDGRLTLCYTTSFNAYCMGL